MSYSILKRVCICMKMCIYIYKCNKASERRDISAISRKVQKAVEMLNGGSLKTR